jgi:hypothetical protein
MANSEQGTLIVKLPEQSGTGKKGVWVKQEFVIETNDQYPRRVCISVWGDKVDLLDKFKEGDAMIVHFNPESREYNNKWYTELKAWKFEQAEAGVKKESTVEKTGLNLDEEESDLPF